MALNLIYENYATSDNPNNEVSKFTFWIPREKWSEITVTQATVGPFARFKLSGNWSPVINEEFKKVCDYKIKDILS